MMHQSEFDAANVALSRAADKRKSLINIHKILSSLQCSNDNHHCVLRWRVAEVLNYS